MKDYYYILGIGNLATTDEIKMAYRKLSLKFHPDKNFGDEFFTDRFKEILEAYEVLSDPLTRKEYDRQKSKNFSDRFESKNGTNFLPIVEAFTCNKASFEYGEGITFSWKTINADKVFISPFGDVEPIGSKTYRLKDFKNKSLTIKLTAQNSIIEKQVTNSITLTNNTYLQLRKHFFEELEKERILSKNQQPNPVEEIETSDQPGQTTVLIVVIVCVVLILAFLGAIVN